VRELSYRLVVPGTPIPKARPKFNRKTGITYTPQTTVRWEDTIRYAALQHPPERLLAGALSATLTFYLPKPKSVARKRFYPEVKPDWDNLGKAVTDALEGLAFKNDSQLVKVIVEKLYGDPPCAVIEVAEIA
jgi:Holliday junction resolvase RusA-like endonuclease